ncbi:MAG TPA: DUF1641 domain-containing protein [Deltaproteobacteria bacterium]|nr:DUF1641 domain-containing protein [Deltaproteobacteria bacterium]
MTTPVPPSAEIERLEARLQRIEARLDRIVAVLDQALPAIAMATDATDEWIGQAQARGVDIDAHATAAIELAEELTEPRAAAALSTVVEALPRLEPALELASNLEPTVAMLADVLDEQISKAQARGIDVDERVAALGGLLERLTEGDNTRALIRAVEALPRLELALELASNLEPTVAMLADVLDEHIRGWQARGIDVEERLLSVAATIGRLTEPTFQRHLGLLLDAAPDLMAATRTGRLFGMAIDEVQSRPAAPIGAIGLLRALSEPEVRRAAGFAVAVARRVGKRLPEGPPGS